MAVSYKSSILDVEKDATSDHAYFSNDSVNTFGWSNVSVTVKDRSTKQSLDILSNVHGLVQAGAYTMPP